MNSPVSNDSNPRRRTVTPAPAIPAAIPIPVAETPLASNVSRGILRTRADRDRAGRAHWTIEALATRWAVSTRTVRRLIDSGQLRAIRIGGQLRVSPEALERFEERQAVRRD
jgi:excisionase family DNA binding protein